VRGRLYDAAFSRHALAELEEAVEHIERESPRNARSVASAILERVELIRRYPRSAAPDPTAPRTTDGAELRRSTVSGFVIRYAFPVRRREREVVRILSIRRAGRLPLEQGDYVLRLLEEAAAAYSAGR